MKRILVLALGVVAIVSARCYRAPLRRGPQTTE